jgi:hypothetical protein
MLGDGSLIRRKSFTSVEKSHNTAHCVENHYIKVGVGVEIRFSMSKNAPIPYLLSKSANHGRVRPRARVCRQHSAPSTVCIT